jgi:hypothetical protein
MSNVVDLTERLNLHESVRPFLTIIDAGGKIAEILDAVFPALTKEQQRVMIALTAWRIMGAGMPASIELLRRLPPLHGMHPESIQAALTQLHDANIIAFQTHGDEGFFAWPALDLVIEVALRDMHVSKIVGADGERLR